MMTLEEESRWMQEMMKMYSMGDPSMFGSKETLILNAKNPLVQYLSGHQDSEHVHTICEHLYDLAMFSHKPLATEVMTKIHRPEQRDYDSTDKIEVKKNR